MLPKIVGTKKKCPDETVMSGGGGGGGGGGSNSSDVDAQCVLPSPPDSDEPPQKSESPDSRRSRVSKLSLEEIRTHVEQMTVEAGETRKERRKLLRKLEMERDLAEKRADAEKKRADEEKRRADVERERLASAEEALRWRFCIIV